MNSVCLTTDDIVRVTQELWGAMLNINLEPVKEPASAAKEVVACVHITGAWTGCVRLDLPYALAREVAAALLGVATEEVSHEQARDAAGEVANITAGSIKALMPGISTISLPTVAEGADFTFAVKDGHDLIRTVFKRNGDKYVVTVLEGDRT